MITENSPNTTRTFTLGELSPYFGVYRSGVGEWLVGGFAMAIMGTMFFAIVMMLGSKLGLPFLLSMPLGVLAGGAAIAAAAVQIRSYTVVAPEGISYVSDWSRLSWFVPSNELVRCDLVSRKAKTLRVVTNRSTHTLLLTSELWSLLRSAG